MEPEDAGLETAEFEAHWTEVRYHEGHATPTELAAAIRRLNDVRRAAADAERRRVVGWVFPWRDERPARLAGN